MGRKKPWSDLHKILHWRDIQDVITDENFGVDRLKGFSVARGQILGFSVGFRRRPYNTLALPCDCVINEDADQPRSCNGSFTTACLHKVESSNPIIR